MEYISSIVLITALLVTSFAQGQARAKSVLLPSSEAQNVTKLCSRGGPAKVKGSWEPMKAELDALESRLPRIAKLRSIGGLDGIQIKHPNHYYRQYVAIIVEGRKLIYINGICQDEPPSNWHERLSDVCDGGCNWGVVYDPSTGQFSDLQTNGVG